MTKKRTAVIGIMATLLLSGCGNTEAHNLEQNSSDPAAAVVEQEEGGPSDAKHIAALYRDLYEEAQKSAIIGDLETTRSFIRRLGENGYAAVDEKNQIDMTNPEQVIQFCEAAGDKEAAELTLIVVSDSGGFMKYDFRTADGMVEVDRGYYQYVDGKLEKVNGAGYVAQDWQYTQEGYLMFWGNYYSESYHALVASDAAEHVAIRVEPLEERCRELNRYYLLPVGYGNNNLFLVNWSETDYGSLDFYDLFDRFYPDIYQRSVPYAADDNLNVGKVYQIPADTFETVIGRYFRIEEEALRQKTGSLSQEGTYAYRPRGFYEKDYSDIPYPEVVNYKEKEDGTIVLTVNAVYPEDNTSRSFTHETVIRPLEEGRYQYVSNQVVYPEETYDAWWHGERLTGEQWQETYKSPDDDHGYCGNGDDSNADNGSETGKKGLEAAGGSLEQEILTAARKADQVYKNAAMEEDLIYGHIVTDFTKKQRKQVVSLLGKAGYVSVTDGVNMENPQMMQDFYAAYEAHQDAVVTVYDVRHNGVIGACTFLYQAGKLQTRYREIAWKEGGIPEIVSDTVSGLKQIKLTKKGYFIYAYEQIPYHSSLRQYWRVSPLSDKCRELTEKYVQGISYVNYNAFSTDWDSSHVEDILMPCMFEDIYRMDTGKQIEPENGEIPAEIYERIMTTYFPATVEQVREQCGYRAQTDSYPYEMIFPRQYPPFGEVVDYEKNPDGTLTLMVDGVWPDYDSDCAFTNRITIQPLADGRFRYLANSIEKGELEIPVVELSQ